jgi:hypothetical protein
MSRAVLELITAVEAITHSPLGKKEWRKFYHHPSNDQQYIRQ